MKQVIQNYKTARLEVKNVPAPLLRRDGLLVRSYTSLISVGTERTKIESARMSLIEKAISRLDLVKIVMANVKQEGLIFTFKKAFNKLETPITLGYSCAGKVMAVGDSVSEFRIGQRVACVGEGYATHAEINSVPADFTVPIPENVDYEEAAFVGLGAIATNAVYITQLKEGEKVAIIGLGLIGQLIAQLTHNVKVHTLGIEPDKRKLDLAMSLGVEAGASPLENDLEAVARSFTLRKGFDAVIIAAASKNNLPLEIAGKICRDKGRVILVGAMPIVIPRKEYYEKELFFIISRGFGGGLYYPLDKERDYPYNYKPRSIRENMERFLALIAEKRVNVEPLITHRFSINEAKEAYELIRSKKNRCLGIIFKYANANKTDSCRDKVIYSGLSKKRNRVINIGFIGAGSFAQGYILPLLQKNKKVALQGVVTASGIKAEYVCRKYKFSYASTDYRQILDDKNIECVFITTRHNLHALLVTEALKAGKKVFVEKPLCLNREELRRVDCAYKDYVKHFGNNPVLMVGFNRRFSPFIKRVKEFFRHREGPMQIIYRINAGFLPVGHWLYNEEGGGRILGEICHFVDLLYYLTESLPLTVQAVGSEDNISAHIYFKDGSIGNIDYNALGDINFPRERLEIFCDGSVAVVDNFRNAVFSRSGVCNYMRRITRDMGYNEEIRLFVDNLYANKGSLIPYSQIIVSTLVTFIVKEAAENQKQMEIKYDGWI